MQLGSNKVDKLYLGANEVTKAYLGSNVVHETLSEYTLVETLGHVLTVGAHPTKILQGQSLTLKYHAKENYFLPANIQVLNATQNWVISDDKTTGTLVVSNPTGNVEIRINAARITYAITQNLTNITISGSQYASIAAGQTLVMTYTADSGYTLPQTVTVTGATSDWKPATGTLTLANATGAVTVTIAGVASSSDDISAGAYTFNDVLDFSNIDDTIKQQLSFVCNGKEYTAMEVLPSQPALNFYYIDDDGIESWSVVYNKAWSNNSYKEFTIERLQEVDTRFKEFILLNSIS